MTSPKDHDNQPAEFDFAPFGYHNPGSTKAPRRHIDIITFVLSIWKPLMVGACLGLLAGVGLYLLQGPLYSASTQILVSKKASTPLEDGEANRYGDRGDHVQLIQTDLIVQRAFKDHGLEKIPALANAYDPYKEVTEGLNVSRSAGRESSFDNVLDINYLHADKEVAKLVVQAIVESYRDYLEDTRNVNAKELYAHLIERQVELELTIQELEKDYARFRKEAPVYLTASPVVTVNGMPTAAQSRYETELAAIETAQNENLRKRSGILAKLATLDRKLDSSSSREALEFWVLHSLSTGTSGSNQGAGGGGGSALTASPEKASLDQQLLTARLLEQRLLHSLGADHSAVRNVQGQIDTILDFYTKQGLTPPDLEQSGKNPLSSRSAALGMDIVTVYRETLEDQLKELDKDDENLAILHEDAEEKAKEAELFEVEDQRRKDEIAMKKEQFERLYDQLAAYDVGRQQEGYRLQQISQVRLERSLKRVIKLVGSCGVLGIALVFSLAYFREWSDSRLKTLDDVRQATKDVVLGSVPEFAVSAESRDHRRGQLSPTLYYYHQPGSREAEAFRSLRTTLLFSMKNGEKVLQMSSPEPGDGKSTLAANLAIATAQSGKKVLLIDTDLRQPTQHFLFGLEQEVGLTDVLLREIEWRNAVRNTPVSGLGVMTAGLCPDNPAELLSGAMFPQMIREARDEYDIIILDSPPVLAVSDPSIVAPHADGMALTVRLKKTRHLTVQRALEKLANHGVKLYGVIANDLDAEAAAADGYEVGNYGSYYRDSESTTSQKTVSPVSTPV
ncbi:MAG: polysaccharide biosynthesis tyrosine autokinase [Planctomycetaceae bacterium]|nr:polysaccharide biosynthesis tyrosine autokinase [Planctomycetaceae bacterium]